MTRVSSPTLGRWWCAPGQFTGRSPNDKFIVDTPTSHDQIWWGKVNRPIAPDRFDELHRRMASYLQGKDVFVHDVWCGADPNHRLWRCASSRSMPGTTCLPATCLSSRPPADLATFQPEFVIIDCPGFHAYPEVDHTNSDVFILVNFDKKMVLIGGTEYGGEIKKSAFTAMNYYLPLKEVMPMHCSANIGPKGDTAIFFGLSGTGKTTLSADPNAAVDRRRRARLGGRRRLQLRGRLLCQGDPAVARGRAGDLCDHAALWDGPGERGHRQHDAPAGL